jgi:D-serine deaminase-like pyridoxal phosphate-dependent protein
MSQAESAAPEAPAAQAQAQPQQVQVHVDDSKALANYANFCRVTGSPEELIVDFGLNPQPVGVPKDPIHVTQRVIMNFYTAKRLLAALQMSVQRHEAVFGVLETDIQKRLRIQQ